MTALSGLDIRVPVGALFALLGALLVAYGMITRGDAAQYEQSLGVNINLWWGLVMTLFGFVFLVLARRGSRAAGARLARESPEGEAIEEREHRTGLER